MKNTLYAFDLDGTVTKEEILPLLASELNLTKEMKLLTRLTLDGVISFEESFRLRFQILNSIPLDTIQNIIKEVELDKSIEKFIIENKEFCSIVTGNLDIWIKPIIERLGCEFFTSTSYYDENGYVKIKNVLYKSDAIRRLRKRNEESNIIAIGESFNDIPMFEEADVGISFGGVHDPVKKLMDISNYVIYDGGALCRLLRVL